jgi:hypothetical protein
LSSVSNGADNFFITKTDADYGPPVPIPLPAAVWAGLALMGGVITKRVINRRQNT